MELSNEQIQQIIPHRYPFLLVDKILDFEPGISAHGIKCVTANEMQFMGHFPEHPIMPGVLIVEALAQVGAVALLSLEENKGKIALFAGIKEAKFRGMVVPGDVLDMKTTIIKQKMGIGVGEAVATVDGKVVCKAELSFAIER